MLCLAPIPFELESPLWCACAVNCHCQPLTRFPSARQTSLVNPNMCKIARFCCGDMQHSSALHEIGKVKQFLQGWRCYPLLIVMHVVGFNKTCSSHSYCKQGSCNAQPHAVSGQDSLPTTKTAEFIGSFAVCSLSRKQARVYVGAIDMGIGSTLECHVGRYACALVSSSELPI
eukprot:2003883-Amphidinium_carterae.1